MDNRTVALPASFRDPRGFVFRREGVLYRQVSQAHRADYERLIGSGLYDVLVNGGLLIRHDEVSLDLAAASSALRVLRPESVPFVSYPYEWGFTQFQDAALLTLDIQEAALARGMTLRDASAFNVTFYRGRPIFLDTTSLGVYEEGWPWVAYRQFCEHFLAPLALMSYRDVRLGQLLRVHLDGVPLDLASSLLPPRARAKPGLAMHLSMHARSQRRHEDDDGTISHRSFSRRAFEGLIQSLRKAVAGLPEPRGHSAWRSYYRETDHYSEEAIRRKEQLVAGWIDSLRPASVWDVGANTGRFSRLASSRGIDTVAFDVDPFCVDETYRTARREDDRHLTASLLDLTNPTPGLGWANEERSSIEERGPADLVLALALIHHIAIGGNVPLGMIIDTLSRLARRVIVEFVPKDDEKVRRLLRDREDIFEAYSAEHFESAAQSRFRIGDREQLGDSGRSLYLLETT